MMKRVRIAGRKGWTMVELIAAIGILGIVSAAVARAQHHLLSSATHAQNAQIMEADLVSLLSRMSMKIKLAGDGLQGEMSPANGKTVIALPDNIISNYIPELIFLSKDRGVEGVMDNQDYWTRYTTATLASGAEALIERTYQTDNWLSIKGGTATLIGTASYPLSNGARFESVRFTLYDSNRPPLIANQDPQATSSIRIAVALKKAESAVKTAKNANIVSRERLVMLEGMLYGPR